MPDPASTSPPMPTPTEASVPSAIDATLKTTPAPDPDPDVHESTDASVLPSPRGSFQSLRTAALHTLTRLSASALSSPSTPPDRTHVTEIEVVYPLAGPLLLDLHSRLDGRGAFVRGFRRGPDDAMGQAEASGRVHPNDMLYAINGAVVADTPFQDIVAAAKTAAFPCTLIFHGRSPPDDGFPSPLAAPNVMPSPTLASPAWGGSWSAKLGQMAETASRRVASFDRKNTTDGTGTSTSSSGTSTPPNPNLNPNGPDAKVRLWGDGTLDKVKNSDGVKTLLRMIGNRSRPEEDRETVAAWMEQLELRAEMWHQEQDEKERDGMVPSFVVVVGGINTREIGTREEDQQEFAVMWYRKTPTQDLVPIKGVHGGRYCPSVDDADATLAVRCESLRFANLVRVVESAQKFELDAAVTTTVNVLLEAGAGAFSATLASNEHDSFQIKITAENVVVLKVSEKESESGVVADVAYHSHLQVLVDPTSPRRFTLKVSDFGSMLGTRPSHVCDVKNKQQLEGVSCFVLMAQNPQHRDILTLLIRSFRKLVLSEDEEEQARREEMSLFADPASSPSMDRVNSSEYVLSRNNSSSFIARPDRTMVDNIEPASILLSPSLSSRLSDILGLDTGATKAQDAVTAPAGPAGTNVVEVAPTVCNTDGDSFLRDRLLAQEKEISLLQDKLASLSVLLKATEHERNEIRATVVVKDTRIESQIMRLEQAERMGVQLAAQSRELQQVRSRLEEEIKLHAVCQQDLAKALNAESVLLSRCDQSVQTDPIEDDEVVRLAQLEALSTERDDLEDKLHELEKQVEKLQTEHAVMQGERNAYRVKHNELAKEVKHLVTVHGSLAEIEAQLADRMNLTGQLSIARAEAKRTIDEMQEYKDTVELLNKQQALAEKEKGTQRLAAQNMELQRLVTQLTESLNDSREQVTVVKKINAALVEKLQRAQPGNGGSIFESPLVSPMSASSSIAEPFFTSDDEDDDDEDEDDDEDNDEEESEQESGRRSIDVDQHFPTTVRPPSSSVQMF